MAYIFSTATGNWATGATWVGGSAPGASDIGVVQTGHTVTIQPAGSPTLCDGFQVNGGTLIINNNITITDGYPFGAWIYNIYCRSAATTKVYSTVATPSNPLTISVGTGSPTYKGYMAIDDVTGPETRTINFDYITLKGFYPFFGTASDDRYSSANLAPNTFYITDVTPLVRETNLLQHSILGRTHGRIYRLGEQAGTCTVTGYCLWDSHFPAMFRNLVASGRRVAVMWDRVIVPYARIEGAPRLTPKRGTQRIDWSITLVEEW